MTTWTRRTMAALVVVGLLAAGCGKGAEDDSGVTTIGLLSAALADTAEASNYRVSLSAGMTLKMAGLEFSAGLDEDNPIAVGEVSPDREHFRINLWTLLEELLGMSLSEGEDFGFEMWVDDERMVMDIDALGEQAGASPDVDMGPFAPGVFFVDLAALEADSPEVMEAISGTSNPDLSQMAVSLPTALTSIEQTSADPLTLAGKTTSARLSEAMGDDIEFEARSDAVDLGLADPAHLDELTELIVQVYETNSVEVIIELDERGLLSVLWLKEDYSDVFRALAGSKYFGAELSEDERREAVELYKSAEVILETRIAYDPDPDLQVPLPPTTAEDRTEEWREFLADSGLVG